MRVVIEDLAKENLIDIYYYNAQYSLKNDIETNKNYEFTFQYKVGTVEEHIKSIFGNAELISIVETDKKGLEQRQDSIQ